MEGRVLILGVTGMLGSKVFEVGLEEQIDILGTSRKMLDKSFSDFPKERIEYLEILDAKTIGSLLEKICPETVINCIGVIKSSNVSEENMQEINDDFPHLLAQECSQRGIRLLQISTDCVFSGKKGKYSEEDTPDPEDLYGRTKLNGEIYMPPHLTIRTSIIGVELNHEKSLISWFLSNKIGSTIKGFTKAVWSGLTTRALAKILFTFAIGENKEVTGLIHVAGDSISKYDLLQLFKKYFVHEVNIVSDESFVCNRSLISKKISLAIPSIEEMLKELVERDLKK
ncbi:SDR family oxidoreductase [Candidatus Woesearchaeota archaeon]|nr:SDR family oxidoreductase [Candidatus Woesearchaeota archaeon]